MRIIACLSLVVALNLGCGDEESSSIIGRPPATPVDRPEPSPLRIAEVYVANADSTEHFAELVVDEDVTLDLATAELCGPLSCVASGLTSVGPGERAVADIGDLDLSPSAGELAVVVDDAVLAYLAWGTAPAVLHSPWAGRAVLSGATEPGAFVPVPFPMPSDVAVANQGDAQGCAQPSRGAESAIDADLCLEVAPFLSITELLAPLDDEAPSWVEIENTSSDDIRLAGVRLCQMPDCVAFGYQEEVLADSYVQVHLGRERPDDSPDSPQIFIPGAAPVRASGELGLLAPGAGDVAADGLLSFVRFGTALSGGLSAAAVSADLWPEVNDYARAPRVAGESLSRNLSGELSGSAWNPAEPTPLAENPDIRATTDLWESCSFPRPWAEAESSSLVVARVAWENPALVVVENRGEEAIDPTGFDIALGVSLFDLAGDELAAGDTLTIQLGCAEAEGLCWADAPALAASGELTLLDDTGVIVQHLRWGDAAGVYTDDAVTAGVWPLSTCTLPELVEGESIQLADLETGHSPPDYQ